MENQDMGIICNLVNEYDILDDEVKELYGNKYEYSSTYTNDKGGKEVILFMQEKKIRAVVVT